MMTKHFGYRKFHVPNEKAQGGLVFFSFVFGGGGGSVPNVFTLCSPSSCQDASEVPNVFPKTFP
jgi:hypothetical protein